MRIFLGIFLACVSFSAEAATKRDLYDLLNRIDNELRFYDQSDDKLQAAQVALVEALDILRGSQGGSPGQACTDFAYEAYRADGYTNSYALERAGVICRGMKEKGTELRIVSFCFEKYRLDGYTNAYSLETAARISEGYRASQLSCIQSSFERFKADGYTNAYSIESALRFCRN